VLARNAQINDEVLKQLEVKRANAIINYKSIIE
jgi:hypothetical protein